jgi:hypothetical protein
MDGQFNVDCPGSLFWKGSLLELIQEQSRHLSADVDGYSRDFILSSNLDEVADSLAKKYVLEPVRLHREQTELIDHGQTTIDAQKNLCLVAYDPHVSRHSAATFYCFAVPFDGDGRLFMRRPSEYEIELPWGEVVGNALHVVCKTTLRDGNTIRSRVDDNLNRVARLLNRASTEVTPVNNRLKELALDRLQRRKSKLTQDNTLAEAIGIPIRPRINAPDAYHVPVQQKRLPVVTVSPLAQTNAPDPCIDNAAYDSILKTISSMARVLELNPKAFAEMDEESLRFMLLVPLNVHYEGQATGEAFNYDGKTDIIIKVGGRNIFIAECKIWKGAETFRAAIDQLLGYTAWRDTKTAIIIFNRNKNLSAVLAQIPDLVKNHPNFKREITSYKNETGFRFFLHQRDDKNREFTLTVLAFDVPT